MTQHTVKNITLEAEPNDQRIREAALTMAIDWVKHSETTNKAAYPFPLASVAIQFSHWIKTGHFFTDREAVQALNAEGDKP